MNVFTFGKSEKECTAPVRTCGQFRREIMHRKKCLNNVYILIGVRNRLIGKQIYFRIV